MFTWMILGLVVVSLFAWKVLAGAIADDKKRKSERAPSRYGY